MEPGDAETEPVNRAGREELAVQLRLGFGQPEIPVELALHLEGLTVVVDIWTGRFDEAWQYLLSAGVNARVETGRGICFGLGELPKLSDLPGQVRVDARGSLEALYGLATTGDGLPATVQVADEKLSVTWYGPFGRVTRVIDDEAASALLASELPFVATPDAWSRLEAMSGFPLLVGRARLNLDGYIELTTAKPQLVESSPLPGLFRIDDTHFGLARAYGEHLDRLRGFQWERVMKPARRPVGPPNTGALELSAHHRADLADLVGALCENQAQVICWEAGLGRRIMALAALEALDAWPALIVAPPWGVWVWQRHFDLAGRHLSLSRGVGDAQLVTYLDLARGARFDTFEALVLDDLSGPDARSPDARRALGALGAIADAYRIGVCSTWPDDLEEACELLDVLRPGEFRLGGSPLAQRYPLAPAQRANEHAAVYLSRRRRADVDVDPTMFPRSEVRLVNLTDAQRQALDALERTSGQERRRLGEICEVLSSGAGGSVAPKVGAAVELARAGAVSGRSVAVVCASTRAANLVRAALAPISARLVDGSHPGEVTPGEVAVVLRRRQAVALGGFDWVVWMEWPWSTETIELSVGAAGAGPERVVVLHAVGTVDDRLAMLAARRREESGLTDPFLPPDDDDLPYLLASRWALGNKPSGLASRRVI